MDSSSRASFLKEREKILKEEQSGLGTMDSFNKVGDGPSLNLMTSEDITKILRAMEGKGAEKALPASSLQMDGYMIPANEGRVAHITMTSPQLSGSLKDNYMNVVKTFATQMPNARITILTAQEREAKMLKDSVRQWSSQGLVENPGRIKIENTNKYLSLWAQDSTLVVGNNVVEQDRVGYPGYDDMKVASELAKVTPELKYRKLEGVYIDGGNQLADRKNIFVGTDAVAYGVYDMKQYPAKYQKIVSDMGLQTNSSMSQQDMIKLIMDSTFPHQKIVMVGYKGKQPAFHIDMAITPLGKKDPASGKPVMLVGDPSMAVKILKDVKTNSPGKYKQYQNQIKDKVSGTSRNPLDTMMKEVGNDRELQEGFDALAKGFEKDGYKVDRVPYLGGTNLHNHPWFTYNNSVIDGDQVFIPNFDIPELDRAGNEKFEKYGYKPIPIDMTAISSMMGAINCITKVVERDYA
jgi:hypothetical protein